MKIKPILFNTEMVRAILEGRKSCTRRVLKQPFEVHPNGYITKPRGTERLCPYIPPYQPGDILYVRETCFYDGQKYNDGQKYIYRADYPWPDGKWYCDDKEIKMKWRPSIHMPKEAARIFLKVTNVRVEKLQNITSKEICSEGVEVEYPHVLNGEEKRYAFSALWNSTIKKSDLDTYGWDANPWVWVIEFERCEKPPECILKGYDKAPDDGSEKCLGYMYDNRDTLLPMCEKCSCQASYESEE